MLFFHLRITDFTKVASSVSNFQGRGLLVPAVTREIVQNLEPNKQHFKNFNGERNKTM